MSQPKMALEPDIVARLEADFDADEYSTALQMLIDSGRNGRVARCIVVAAGGSIDELARCIRTAQNDYRDAIVAGEYDRSMKQIRDLRASFLLDSPLDFWISELAVFLHSRGFTLTSLDSNRSTDDHPKHICDVGHGTATFQRDDDELNIRKHDGNWQVLGDAERLQEFQLHVPFDDEQQFRNQLELMLNRD